MLKTGASVAVLTLLLGATAAVSQTTMPQQRPAPPAPSRTDVPKAPVPGQIVVQDANTVLAKELIGQTVYAPDKAKIGSISDLILSKDAKTVDGFVIGVGGFLGIGEKSVAMKLDRLQITHDAQSGGVQVMMTPRRRSSRTRPRSSRSGTKTRSG
jgi:hypothetical protein